MSFHNVHYARVQLVVHCTNRFSESTVGALAHGIAMDANQGMASHARVYNVSNLFYSNLSGSQRDSIACGHQFPAR